MAPEKEKWKEQLPWFLTLYIPTFFEQKSTRHPTENEHLGTCHAEVVKEWPVLARGRRRNNKRGLNRSKLSMKQSPFPIQVPLIRKELVTRMKGKKDFVTSHIGHSLSCEVLPS